MAKKKKTRRAGKKSTKRTVKKPSRKSAKPRSTPKKSSGSKSVDALLKRFAKQRAVTETQLAALRKTQEESEKKAAKIREQLDKLADRQRKLEADLAKLDGERDQEVSRLLASLGVQVGGQAGLSVFGERDRPAQEGAG